MIVISRLKNNFPKSIRSICIILKLNLVSEILKYNNKTEINVNLSESDHADH